MNIANNMMRDMRTRDVREIGRGWSIHTRMRTLSSQRSGKCKRMARGTVSAAKTMKADKPRLRVLVPEYMEQQFS